MKKIIFVFGGISGLIVVSMFFITMPLYKNGTLSFGNGQWIGYTTMVIALSLTFFGVKTYRDQHLGGVISFGTALKTGVLIALVASVVYVIGWEINLAFFTQDFMEFYAACQIKLAEGKGASSAEISKLTTDLRQLSEYYKNPPVRMLLTWLEIFPVGAVVALICAVILRRREILPA